MTRTLPSRTALGALGFVLSSVLALCLVRNAWLAREHEQARTSVLKHELSIKQGMAVMPAAYAAQLQDMHAIVSTLEQRLPAQLDSSVIERGLHDRAERDGLAIETLQVGKQRQQDFYADIPVDLIVRGSTSRFLTFMNGFLRESPLRRIAVMSIEPIDDATRMRATMTVAYYRYIEDGE